MHRKSLKTENDKSHFCLGPEMWVTQTHRYSVPYRNNADPNHINGKKTLDFPSQVSPELTGCKRIRCGPTSEVSGGPARSQVSTSRRIISIPSSCQINKTTYISIHMKCTLNQTKLNAKKLGTNNTSVHKFFKFNAYGTYLVFQ